MFPRLMQAARGSGPCVDSPALLRLLAGSAWLRVLALNVLRFKFSPTVLERVRALPAPLEERARLFTQGVSLLSTGGSFKTTGADRTRLGDSAVLRLAEQYPAPRVMEVGASDGSASLRLLAALPPQAQLILTDRHPVFLRLGCGPASLTLDSDGRLLGLKLFCLYLRLPFGLQHSATGCQRIDTLNPLLSEGHGVRAIRPFDALSDRLPEPVQIIKCANLFNRAYFSDQAIRAAVANLARSLVDGGHLVISQNNACYEGGEACFVLQRKGPAMVLVEEQGGHRALELFQEAGA